MALYRIGQGPASKSLQSVLQQRGWGKLARVEGENVQSVGIGHRIIETLALLLLGISIPSQHESNYHHLLILTLIIQYK